jgi:hypothetical protein
LGDAFQFVVVGEALQQAGQLTEEGSLMIGRVEKDLIGHQGAGIVDKSVVQVALLTPAHGVGELVLMEVDGRGNVMGQAAGQGQEGRQVQHVGGQDEIGLEAHPSEPPGQGDRSAVHAPLPKPPRQAQQLHLVAAASTIAIGPGLVGASVVRFDKKNLHHPLIAAIPLAEPPGPA